MSVGQGLTGARATGFGHGVTGRTQAAPSAGRAAPDEDERGTGVAGWGRRQKGSGGRGRLTGADPSARGGAWRCGSSSRGRGGVVRVDWELRARRTRGQPASRSRGRGHKRRACAADAVRARDRGEQRARRCGEERRRGRGSHRACRCAVVCSGRRRGRRR